MSKSTEKVDSSVDNRGRDDYPACPEPPPLEHGFWRDRALEELSAAEWEALCDGCAKCCLLKIEYGASGVVHYTNVRCRLLDGATCRCTDYANRSRRVSDCVTLDPAGVRAAYWLPQTCAYRRVAAAAGFSLQKTVPAFALTQSSFDFATALGSRFWNFYYFRFLSRILRTAGEKKGSMLGATLCFLDGLVTPLTGEGISSKWLVFKKTD